MRICICDDEKAAVFDIENRLKEFENSNNVSFEIDSFYSLDECKNGILQNDYDVVIMDIEVGDGNGIEALIEIKRDKPDIIVFYVSAYPEYVFSSFETEPLNFIKKPIDAEIFYKTIQRAVDKYVSLNESISVKWRHTATELLIKDICYIEGYQRHLLYHLINSEKYEAVGKLSKLCPQLLPHGFVQSHQGFLVNMQQIKSFGEDEIYMKNGDTVLMSVRRKLATKQAYYEYLMRG